MEGWGPTSKWGAGVGAGKFVLQQGGPYGEPPSSSVKADLGWPLRGLLLALSWPSGHLSGVRVKGAPGKRKQEVGGRESGDMLCPRTNLEDVSIFILIITSSTTFMELKPKLPTRIESDAATSIGKGRGE